MTDSDRSAGISYGTQPLLRFEEVAITWGGAPAIGSALASGGVWHTKLLAPEFFLLHRPHSVQAWRFMMIGHVSVGVTDLERSRRFYDAALGPLGLVRILDFEGRGSDYGAMAPRSASN